MPQQTTTRELKHCPEMNIYVFRNARGQQRGYTYDELYGAIMSEESRAVMGQLLAFCADHPNQWVAY